MEQRVVRHPRGDHHDARSLDLHPLLVLLATASGGAVAGMIGLILAAPALAIGLDIKHELEASGFFADDP
jgi:predicted PurR-regulated permease PerM